MNDKNRCPRFKFRNSFLNATKLREFRNCKDIIEFKFATEFSLTRRKIQNRLSILSRQVFLRQEFFKNFNLKSSSLEKPVRIDCLNGAICQDGMKRTLVTVQLESLWTTHKASKRSIPLNVRLNIWSSLSCRSKRSMKKVDFKYLHRGYLANHREPGIAVTLSNSDSLILINF